MSSLAIAVTGILTVIVGPIVAGFLLKFGKNKKSLKKKKDF